MYSVGTPGQADFRAYTINRDAGNRDLGPLIGFSHGGVYINDSFNQFNASYRGWAADDAGQLLNAIELETRGSSYSIVGNVDQTTLPPSGDPLFDAVTPGTVARGLADIGTAFAWDLDADQDDARVTTFVEFLPSDPVDPFLPALPARDRRFGDLGRRDDSRSRVGCQHCDHQRERAEQPRRHSGQRHQPDSQPGPVSWVNWHRR